MKTKFFAVRRNDDLDLTNPNDKNTMHDSLNEEINDALNRHPDGTQLDIYEVTFKKIKVGTIVPRNVSSTYIDEDI